MPNLISAMLNIEPHPPTNNGAPPPSTPENHPVAPAAVEVTVPDGKATDGGDNPEDAQAAHASQNGTPTEPNSPAANQPIQTRIGYEILTQGALAWAAQKGADTSCFSSSKGKAPSTSSSLTQEALAHHNALFAEALTAEPARALNFNFAFPVDRQNHAATPGSLHSPFHTPLRRSASGSTNDELPNPAFSSPAPVGDEVMSPPSVGQKRKATEPLEDGQIRDPQTPLAKRTQKPGALRAFPSQATYASSGPRTPTPGWSHATHTSRRTPRPPTPGPSTRTYRSATRRDDAAGNRNPENPARNRYAALAEDEVLPSFQRGPSPPTPTPAHSTAEAPPELIIDSVIEFFLPFTKMQRTAVLDAHKRGLIRGPDVSKKDTEEFWPDALRIAMENSTPAGGPGRATVTEVDDADDYIMVEQLPDLQDVEDEDEDEVYYDYDPTGEPEDTQNLVVTPCAIPNGGRLTNRPHPLPRPHHHLAADIQPPIQAEYSEEPTNGFPKVRRDDPEGLFAGGEREKICSITLDCPRNTCVVEPLCYGGIKQGEGWRITKDILGLLEDLFGLKNLVVIPAETQDPPPRLDMNDIHTRIPRFIGVTGIPREIVRMLVMQQTWATRNFAANFFSPLIRFDDYLGRLEGFVHDVADAIEVLMKAKFEEDPVRSIIKKYVVANPHRNHDEPEVAVQKIINSLRIRTERIEPDQKPVTHIYLDTPTHTVETYRAYRREIRALRFLCGNNGTGVWINEQPCWICNSVEHVALDCPLTRLTNWRGPAFTFKSNQNRGDARGANARGRTGFRGRGRPYRG